MSLLSKANQVAKENLSKENMNYIQNIRIVYPSSAIGESEDNGKCYFGENIIGNKITVKPLAIRGFITKAKTKRDKADGVLIQPIQTEDDILFQSEEVLKFLEVAKIESKFVSKAIDVLVYCKEIEDFATILFKPSSVDDFSELDLASSMSGVAEMETYQQPNCDQTWFRYRSNQINQEIDLDEKDVEIAKKVFFKK